MSKRIRIAHRAAIIMLGLLLVAMISLPFSFAVYADSPGQSATGSQSLDTSQNTGSIALTLQVVDNRKPDVVVVPKTDGNDQAKANPITKTISSSVPTNIKSAVKKIPQTSDDSHIMLLIILMTAACSALTLAAVFRDEEKYLE